MKPRLKPIKPFPVYMKQQGVVRPTKSHKQASSRRSQIYYWVNNLEKIQKCYKGITKNITRKWEM